MTGPKTGGRSAAPNLSIYDYNPERSTEGKQFVVFWQFLAYLTVFRAKTPQDARHAGG